MQTQEQIQLINDTINKTKENLKSSAPNFIFWGALIAVIESDPLWISRFHSTNALFSANLLGSDSSHWNGTDCYL